MWTFQNFISSSLDYLASVEFMKAGRSDTLLATKRAIM
jgi:hypothetical protein